MVGLIHKILFNMLESTAEPEVALEIRRRAEVPADKEFHINEVYDDEEWQRLFAATISVLNLTQEQVEEVYAEHFIKDGQERWPVWFTMAKTAREFLIRQPKIHNGFATSQQDPVLRSAIDDKFHVEERDDELVVHYQSPNKLCGLYKSLATKVLNLYQEDAQVDEACCMKQGSPECEIHIRWS
ncbi:MAG: heme NO-binding domain-containing protein [Phycisphaerae bacterium]|nr:heme NO-binding domain-containing protein [Phycisphaerales bacterium]